MLAVALDDWVQLETSPEEERVREELASLNLRELKQQARDLGVAASVIDAVDDAVEPKQAAVEALVQHNPDLLQSGALVRYMHSVTGETSMTIPGPERLVPFLRGCGISLDFDSQPDKKGVQVKRLNGDAMIAPPSLPPPNLPPPPLESTDQKKAHSLGPGLKALKRASSNQNALLMTQAIFDEIDQDKSGLIDAEELLAWSNQQGAHPSMLAKLLEAFQITGDSITLEVFREILVAISVEGWKEEIDGTGGILYRHAETGETTSIRPGIDRLDDFLCQSGISTEKLAPPATGLNALKAKVSAVTAFAPRNIVRKASSLPARDSRRERNAFDNDVESRLSENHLLVSTATTQPEGYIPDDVLDVESGHAMPVPVHAPQEAQQADRAAALTASDSAATQVGQTHDVQTIPPKDTEHELFVQTLFDSLDANGSGVLEYGELREWWLRRGGDPSVLDKLEAAFAIAGQAAGAVDRTVFREVLIAVAVDGWMEETNPATGQPWYVHSVTGETTETRPDITHVSEWLYRSGIAAESLVPAHFASVQSM